MIIPVDRATGLPTGSDYTSWMPAAPPPNSAERSARLASVRREIRSITTQSLALPGGFGDAVLRDRLEDLEAEERRLCLELGLPVDELQGRARGVLGWVLLILAVVTLAAVILVVR